MHVIDNGFKSLFDDFQQSEDQSVDPQPFSGPPLNVGQSDSHTVYVVMKTDTLSIHLGVFSPNSSKRF